MRLLIACLLLAPLAGVAQSPQVIPVGALAQAPKVDGKLADWGRDGWISVAIKPALAPADRAKFGLDPADDKNQTGSLTLQLKAGVNGGRLYLALKYPDPAADTVHRPWEWRGALVGLGTSSVRRGSDQAELSFFETCPPSLHYLHDCHAVVCFKLWICKFVLCFCPRPPILVIALCNTRTARPLRPREHPTPSNHLQDL